MNIIETVYCKQLSNICKKESIETRGILRKFESKIIKTLGASSLGKNCLVLMEKE